MTLIPVLFMMTLAGEPIAMPFSGAPATSFEECASIAKAAAEYGDSIFEPAGDNTVSVRINDEQSVAAKVVGYSCIVDRWYK